MSRFALLQMTVSYYNNLLYQALLNCLEVFDFTVVG